MLQTMIQRASLPLFLTGAVILVWTLAVGVGEAGKKSDSVVKVKAEGGKIEDNKQVVTVTLTIDKGWHIYANPVGAELLASNQTVVKVTGKTKPEKVVIDYPKGELIKDKSGLEYRTYEGTVQIKATVFRAAGDTDALEVSVEMNACDDKKCLLPGVVKLTVK